MHAYIHKYIPYIYINTHKQKWLISVAVNKLVAYTLNQSDKNKVEL